jgi:hypothetical protein
VLSNWDNVLRAISMASSELAPSSLQLLLTSPRVKVPQPSNGEEDNGEMKKDERQLPITLVRIPAQTNRPSGQNGGLES